MLPPASGGVKAFKFRDPEGHPSNCPGEAVGVVPRGDISHAIPARAVWVREDERKWTYAGLEFLDTEAA